MTSKELMKITLEDKLEGIWLDHPIYDEEYRKWHSNGVLSTQFFHDDNKINGESKAWYENGQLWERCFYLDDLLDGRCTAWDKDGNIILDVTLAKGKQTIDHLKEN